MAHIKITIRAITPDTSNDIEQGAATNLFWQVPQSADLHPQEFDAEFEMQLWIHRVLLEWGICGYTAYVSTGQEGSTPLPAATVIFAPPAYLPGEDAFPSGPASPDAILITSVYVALPYMGLYLEHQLIDTVMEEARRRGMRAVEAFARVEPMDEELEAELSNGGSPNYIPEAYRGWEAQLGSTVIEGVAATAENTPMLSDDILEEQGFHIIQYHKLFPRYRKEIAPTAGLFAKAEADRHAELNGSQKIGTAIGGSGSTAKRNPGVLQAGKKNPFI